MFTRTIFDASGGQITINYDQPIYISTPVQAVEFVRRNTGEGYYAQLDNLLIDALNKIGIAATTYDGITRVYPSSAAYSNCVPASTPGYLNCIKGMTSPSWQNYYIPNSAKAPGVSAITVYAGNRPAIVNPATGKSELWETMFHEYQHMMGHRFFNTGINNYGDPDKYGVPGHPSAPDFVSFYYRLMEKLLDGTTVPYLKLENIFGRFEG
jgi:hypothetical protein